MRKWLAKLASASVRCVNTLCTVFCVIRASLALHFRGGHCGDGGQRAHPAQVKVYYFALLTAYCAANPMQNLKHLIPYR